MASPKAVSVPSRKSLADLERSLADLRKKLKAEKARSARLQQAAAREERQKIAQTLHDTVCQSLNGANLEAAVLFRSLEAKRPEGAPDPNVLRGMLRQAVNEMHEVLKLFRRDG